MSALIKAGAGTFDLRSLPVISAALPLREAAPRQSAAEMALDEATAEIARLEATIEVERDAAVQAEIDAREAGYAEGLRAAETGAAERLTCVEAAIEAAQVRWTERLAEIDGLAAMLAQEALSRIFGSDEDLAERVTRAIAARVRQLGQTGIVAIRVSAKDFGDADAVAALAGRAKRAESDLVVDATLASGECRIDLQLGHLDIGLGSQWGELDTFLRGLAAGDGAK